MLRRIRLISCPSDGGRAWWRSGGGWWVCLVVAAGLRWLRARKPASEPEDGELLRRSARFRTIPGQHAAGRAAAFRTPASVAAAEL